MTAESSMRWTSRPLPAAILAQILGTALAAVLVLVMPELLAYPWVVAALQGASSAIASHRLGAASWWQAIHLCFAPLALLASTFHIPPAAWLGGFVLLLLIFWRTDTSQVPLYLTNNTAAAALVPLLPKGPHFVADLGCGDGRVLRHLARQRPDCEFVGYEHAPLTWLFARLMSSSLNNVHIRYGSFWDAPLAPFDLIYAFLSPAPMPQLWKKSCAEMRPKSQLVTNSFAIPDANPSSVIKVNDRRKTVFYLYDIADR
jgi:hypothetical protein